LKDNFCTSQTEACKEAQAAQGLDGALSNVTQRGVSLPTQGVAPGDLYGSLPTQTLLWFTRKRELCQTNTLLPSCAS